MLLPWSGYYVIITLVSPLGVGMWYGALKVTVLGFPVLRFYPYHFAPYVSDLKDFANINIKFELESPFKPFQQLLAVLPPASKRLLPPAYQVFCCGFHANN